MSKIKLAGVLVLKMHGMKCTFERCRKRYHSSQTAKVEANFGVGEQASLTGSVSSYSFLNLYLFSPAILFNRVDTLACLP